jgi:uncharacterized peroxidase-related enzyme
MPFGGDGEDGLAQTRKKEASMTRFSTPSSIEASPAASRPLLEAVQKQFGVVPNIFRLIGNSPAALEGLLGLQGGLGKGALEPATRSRIAVAVAEVNGCNYCLSAHSYIGKNLAKLSDDELAANREGGSVDGKANAAIQFAVKLVKTRGHVSNADVEAVRKAGYNDAQIIEIVLHVGLNTLTNYINVVADTEIDFPVIKAKQQAA